TAIRKITTMMALTRMRPSSMAWYRHLGLARAPDVKADACQDKRDQDHRHRPHEEGNAAEADRLLQRIFRDLSENDTDDERRAGPIVALKQITEAAEPSHEHKVLPIAAEEVAAEQREHEHIRNEKTRFDRAQFADPRPRRDQHDYADDIGDHERPD